MPNALDPIAGERIARHGFSDRPARSVLDAVRRTTAIQAQDVAAARLGVRSRATGVTDADVTRALEHDRSVVRTWLMRATIHLVAAADVRWLTAAIGPSFARKFAKRWRDMGLTGELLERTFDALPDVLAAGPLPLSAIMSGLAEHGVAIGAAVGVADPQAPYHVLLHATGRGLTCRGPQLGRDATFALIDQWLPDTAPDAPLGPTGDEGLAELARRYFTAFSPATAADFSTWSGLPSTRAIALIREELTPVSVGGRAGFRLGEVEPQRGIRLLSAFDNYLVGYRDRDLVIDGEHRRAVYVGGMINPAVLVDGRVAGVWKLRRTAGARTVSVNMFGTVTRPTRRAITAEVEDIAAFLGTDIALEI